MTPFRAALVSIVLIGMAGLQVAGAPNPQLQVDGSWKRLRSQNFVAVGDANAGELRRALSELEGFRKALLEIFPSLRVTSPVPTLIVAVKDQQSFERFKPLDSRGRRMDNVGAYFMALPDVNYIVLPMYQQRQFTFQVVFHEYTHYIV